MIGLSCADHAGQRSLTLDLCQTYNKKLLEESCYRYRYTGIGMACRHCLKCSILMPCHVNYSSNQLSCILRASVDVCVIIYILTSLNDSASKYGTFNSLTYSMPIISIMNVIFLYSQISVSQTSDSDTADTHGYCNRYREVRNVISTPLPLNTEQTNSSSTISSSFA